MKPRIKSTIWNIRKKKAFNQNSKKKKRIKKNKVRIRRLGHLQMYQNPNHRDARRRRVTARN